MSLRLRLDLRARPSEPAHLRARPPKPAHLRARPTEPAHLRARPPKPVRQIARPPFIPRQHFRRNKGDPYRTGRMPADPAILDRSVSRERMVTFAFAAAEML